MSRILVGTFVATTFLLTSNSFARDKGSRCGTNCPPVSCDTVVSNSCDSCGSNCPPVGCGTVVSNVCASYSSGACESGHVANTGSGAIENVGGSVSGQGSVSSSGSVGGQGAASSLGSAGGQGSVTGQGRLDPDVLTGQTGSSLGQQSINTERIWTDSSGKHQRLARFVRIEGTQVVLQSAQGRTTRVDIQKLSSADQLFLDQLRQTSMKAAFQSNQQTRVATRL